MITRMTRWMRSGLRRWWNRMVERELLKDAESREERQARVRRLDHEVQSLERAVRRMR